MDFRNRSWGLGLEMNSRLYHEHKYELEDKKSGNMEKLLKKSSTLHF